MHYYISPSLISLISLIYRKTYDFGFSLDLEKKEDILKEN